MFSVPQILLEYPLGGYICWVIPNYTSQLLDYHAYNPSMRTILVQFIYAGYVVAHVA